MPDVMAPPDRAEVRITPAPPLTRLLLRGDPGALGAELGLTLPTTPCSVVPGERAVLWLGPDEWLLLAAGDAPRSVWESKSGAVFDISDRQVGFIIEGERAAEMLAVGCPLDLAAFAVDTCARTVFGKAEIVLWRRDATSFHVETWRSFAPYVRQLLSVPASAP